MTAHKMVKTKIKDPELIKKRQRQICRGAMKVFRKKGFHATSVREIAKASRISLGSLYDYIEKKEDILFLVHRHILDQIYSGIDESVKKHNNPLAQITFLLRENFRRSIQLKEDILFIYTETKTLDKRYMHQVLQRESEFVGAFEKIIKKGVHQGVFECSKH